MKGVFDTQSLDIVCPRCGQKTAKTVGWLKAHDELACPGCSGTIHLEHDQLLADIRRAEKALKGFPDRL